MKPAAAKIIATNNNIIGDIDLLSISPI